jgi:hypothetical protein
MPYDIILGKGEQDRSVTIGNELSNFYDWRLGEATTCIKNIKHAAGVVAAAAAVSI